MTSNYPNALDDNTSLMPIPGNRQTYTLDMSMEIDDLEFRVDRLITGVTAPAYMAFQGGEIVLVTSYDTNIFYMINITGRGALGSRIQPHRVGEGVVIGMFSVHLNQIKRGIEGGQRHQGFVGLDADKSEFPDPGMRYTALDSGKIYYCFQVNVWTWVNKISHADLTGLSEDDHTQYHNNARAAAWHGVQAGYHIVGGNDHTHMTGEPAVRIAHGWNIAKPENPEDGQVYFSTNLDGGTLFVGQGGAWRKMVGIPPGGIVAFNGPCPTGWTRYAALDGKLPMGSISSGVGETGGTTQHRHAYTDNVKHYHTVNGAMLDASDAGAHTHSITIGTGNTGDVAVIPAKSSYASTTDYSTSDAGQHDHTAVVPQITTGTTGAAVPYTDYASNYPASKEVIWCKKD